MIKHAAALLLAALLAMAGAAQAINPELRLRDDNHAGWSTRDGAPAEVSVMAQTPDGWLWLGASTGLYRFDGVRFERIELPTRGEVAKRRITNLRAEDNGDLWISFSVGGLSVLRASGKLEDIVPLDSHLFSISSLTIDQDGSAWLAARTGLYHYAEGQLRKFGPEQGLPQDEARTVLRDQYQQILVLFGDGVYRLDRVSGKFALLHAQRNQGSIIQSPDGRVWISDAEQITPLPAELTRPSQAGATLPRPASFNAAESRRAAQFDRDGNLWTRQCPEGLCVVARAAAHAGSPLTPARDATDKRDPQITLTSHVVNAVMEDREGNLWLATQNGLDRFRENSIIPLRLPQASGNFSVAGDGEGGVWLSDRSTRITWRLSASRAPERLPKYYQNVANGRDGALLLADAHSIERRHAGQVIRIPLPPGRDGRPVEHEVLGLVDDGKVLWMASAQIGLMGYIDGHWQPRSAFSMPPRIFLGGAGRKPGQRWQATGDGTVVFNDNGKLTSYDAAAIGLATMVAGTGEVVVIGGDQGLAVFTGQGFRKLRAARPEALNNISGMAVGADGDRWFNGSQGVVHVRRADWEAALRDPATPLQYDLLGMLEGYSGQAMLENRLPSVHMDSDGHIWFLTSDGVVRLSPAQLRRNVIAPVPQVLSVEVGRRSYRAAATLHLPPGSQNFSIQFTAPGLGKPEAMRFQYQLSGVNEEWQDAGNRRIAYYTNVAPGSYTFRVRAFNEDGVPSTADARLALEIEPTFMQTIWFKGLCALMAAGLLYLLYLYRVRVATGRVADRLLVRMAERERIARTLHDTFLQSVQALILRLDLVSNGLPADARDRLQPILDQANDTIVEGRDQVYELRTGRVDDVESAATEAGRQLAQEHPATAFSISVTGTRRKLRGAVAEEACEIAREALRNAWRHAGAAQVQAQLAYEGEQFVLRISDNGIGIAADAPSKERHYGLLGMRERAVRAGGKLDIATTPGNGVCVTLTVPARLAYIGGRRWWQRAMA